MKPEDHVKNLMKNTRCKKCGSKFKKKKYNANWDVYDCPKCAKKRLDKPPKDKMMGSENDKSQTVRK